MNKPKELPLTYYKAEGFRVGESRCKRCGYEWIAVIHPDVVPYRLECPKCKTTFNLFKEL